MPSLVEDKTVSVDQLDRRIEVYKRPFGAEVEPDGGVTFRLWAPNSPAVSVVLEDPRITLACSAKGDGWHELKTFSAQEGTRYWFELGDGDRVPDPAALYQPECVEGPSEVINAHSFPWLDTDWPGRRWEEAVFYEIHIGAFTQEGTFLAAIEKLDYLVDLGVTGITIMPVGDFPGRRNWGYDGVYLYAPDSAYGRPEHFKQLVQQAHLRGLMVILDVVYNHFGPEGNYLPKYAPRIFTKSHQTPWGDAINCDERGCGFTREFIIQNALYWIEQFHLDGLRLDAVHHIKDDSPKHLVEELAERVHALLLPRAIHLVLENEQNNPRWLSRSDDGRPLQYTAQWNDDVHHALHVAVTKETNGYYQDFAGDTDKLGRAIAEGFAFQGEVMRTTESPRGAPSAYLPPTAFVSFLQNHDQIGNRAFGERLHALASPEAVRAVACVYLLLPQIPMLFMGEEWASSSPFQFFCDYDGELGDSICKGRHEEFASFPKFQDPAQRDLIPDPRLDETFLASKLNWSEIREPRHAECLRWYRKILSVRHEYIVPLLARMTGHSGMYKVVGDGAVTVRFCTSENEQLLLSANLSDSSKEGFPIAEGRTICQQGLEQVGTSMPPWSVRWSLKSTDDRTSGRQAVGKTQLATKAGSGSGSLHSG